MIAPTAEPHPLTLAFVEACQQAGHPLREDFNCGELEGTGTHDMTIVDGHRQTTADAFVRPALSRPNLTVGMRALARRLTIEKDRCSGVEYHRDGSSEPARAGREVVLYAPFHNPWQPAAGNAFTLAVAHMRPANGAGFGWRPRTPDGRR